MQMHEPVGRIENCYKTNGNNVQNDLKSALVWH